MGDGYKTAAQEGEISFDPSLSGAPRELVRLSPYVRRMVAGNSGPMTFTGTCTYVIGTGKVAIIDPGPDRTDHINALLAALRGRPSQQFASPIRIRITRRARARSRQ
jgi:hypothetical protein